MSVLINGDTKLYAFSNKITQRYFVSNYYTLTNSNISIEYKNLINLNSDPNFYLSHYLTNFGDGIDIVRTSPEDIVSHTYKFPGSYFITYSAVYVDLYDSIPQQKSVITSLNTINKIIEDNKVIPKTTPNGVVSDSSYEHANYNILKYKPQLQLQLVEYAKYHFPSAMNNDNALSAKCFRDMGYIIDAVAADILNNANHRSIDIANMYFQVSLVGTAFPGSSIPTLPASEVPATIDCIKKLKTYITGLNIPSQPAPFTDVGILSSVSLGSPRISDVSNRIDDIVYTLENGGLLKSYLPTGNPSAKDISFSDVILQNRSRIQNEVKIYVTSKGYLSNPILLSKCNRDVGLIVDAIAYELKTGVMSKSIEYGLTYWDGNVTRIPNSSVSNHKAKTIDSFNQIGYSIYNILLEQSNNSNVKTYSSSIPFVVKGSWETFNQNDIRLNDEIVLKLPYTLEQIYIQPNEWGVEDIVNTSFLRLNECLQYLISKTKTINTYSPTMFFGWLGNAIGTPSSIIKWHTQSYNQEYLNSTELAKSSGSSYFTNVIDILERENLLYVLDDGKIKFFTKKANPTEVVFSNGDQISGLFVDANSFAANEYGDFLYVSDKSLNTIFKLKLSQDLNINIQLFVGGFGGLKDNNNFNIPTDINFKNNNLYVLDYNNLCIKQYNEDLNWLYTYNIPEFDNDIPVSFDVLKNGLIYVLTEKNNVYIFDNFSNNLFESFSAPETMDNSELLKIRFSENDDFVYILTGDYLYKYTLTGIFVTTFVLPKNSDSKYTNAKSGSNGTVLVSSNKFISKCHDILQVFGLGGGLPYRYWDSSQLIVDKNEFSSDINYNRSFARTVQNIKSFRDTLNAKFVIANENVKNNIITYFSYLPINLLLESPKFSDDVENEIVGVGINELHVPPVLNKEFKKLYEALEILNKFLSIETYFVKNSDCTESFCWSWDATSCYNLSLPVIKTCSINPISYTELKINKLNTSNTYAPLKCTWENAKSKCCEKPASA